MFGRSYHGPPPANGQKKQLTSGYPAITATLVNLPEPVVPYANWFSYVTADFISENREIERAIRITRALFSNTKLRFVGDAGLDDQKIFHQVARVKGQFIFRASTIAGSRSTIRGWVAGSQNCWRT